MLNLSMERPDVIDAGVRDWNDTSMGPHHGRVKDPMPWKEQVCPSLEPSLAQAQFTHTAIPGDRRCSLAAYIAAAVSDTLSPRSAARLAASQTACSGEPGGHQHDALQAVSSSYGSCAA